MLHRPTLTRRYFLLSVLATAGALTLVFFFLLGHRWYTERQHLRQDFLMQTSLIGHNASAVLAFADAAGAQEILELAARLPQLQEIALYLPNGRLLGHYARPERTALFGSLMPLFESDDSLSEIHLVVPVRMEEENLGSIAVVMSLDSMYLEIGRFSLALLASAIAATLIGHIATRQLREHMAHTERELQRMALYDRVTQLANRHAFELSLEQQLQQHTRAGGTSALLFIDVDGFKKVNDVFGHAIGDQVLQTLAQRLTLALRSSDIIARIGGDEFGVILANNPSPLDVARIADHLIQVAEGPIQCESGTAQVGLSIGISMIPQDGETATMQMLHADMAMYHAKQNGKNRHQFFSEALGGKVKRRLELESALQSAIETRQFEVVYQPQMHPGTSQPVCLEALVRWQRPGHGLIAPAEFIPLAEESGLILGIGRIVQEQVCRDISNWRKMGLQAPVVAINTSARQLSHGNLREELTATLGHYGLTPNDIEIELTESLLMGGIDSHLQQLADLDQAGFSIAVDDFGTGYSSLSYLQRLPLDKLKIDMSFVRRLGESPESLAIVRGIIGMAHAIELVVVAEGVETETQASLLHDNGCDLMQGYLFGRPVAAAEIQRLLAPVSQALR